MNPEKIEPAQRKAARVAGVSCLVTMAAVVFANFGINERLIVHGNVAQTAQNILAHQTLFRIGIACDLIYVTGLVILLTALYVILKPVNRGLALLATFWRFLYAMVWVLMTLNLFDVLRFLSGTTSGSDYLHAFEAERLQALARFSLAASFDTYYVGLLFFALASTACSYLWFKSNYIPRALAVLGIVGSAFCVACTFAFILFPNFSKVVNLWWFDSPMGIFEMVLSLWLLIRGLRSAGIAEPVKATS